MDVSDRLLNPRVIAGTLSGFEAFATFRSPIFDPLKSLLPIAVEVESLPGERRREILDAFQARSILVDVPLGGRGVVRLAGAFDRFELLEGVEDDRPEGFRAVAHAVARTVKRRFRRRFEVPTGRGTLTLDRRPLVMGILNVTPDSFSDGGRYADPDRAIERAFQMVEAGADIVDVGAESTRPGSPTIDADEEARRLLPVMRVLLEQLRVPVSLDTRKARVAERFLEMGVAIVNDVSGLDHDPRLADVVARSGAALVLNHMRGTPQTMQEAPRYDDVTADVCRSLRERIERAGRAGVGEDRILLDPGIGFGKRLEDNLDILARLGEIRSLGRPLVLGCSRKSFLGRVTGRDVEKRDAATAATTALATLRGVKVVRVHDVETTVDVVSVLDAIDEQHHQKRR